MKLARIGALSLACVSGALAFGVAANAALDLVFPVQGRSLAKVDAALLKADAAPVKAAPALVAPVVAQAPAAEPQAAAGYSLASSESKPFALASATSTPAELAPVRVKTIPLTIREDRLADAAEEPRIANVPLPRKRPASAPGAVMAMASTDVSGSIARKPGTMAIAAATRKGQPDDGEVLGSAGIERMRVALALTEEQSEYWPAIASELQAVGKLLKAHKSRDGKLDLDNDTLQRLYWACAPLLSRLSYEQKQKVKQMAHVMGLPQVAAAI